MTDTYQEFLMAGMDWYYVRRDTAFINMVAAKGDLARHAEASAEFARICRLGNLFTGDTNDTLHSSVDRETALCNSIDDDEALFRLEASLPSDRRGTSRQEDTWFMRRVRRDLDRLDEILTSHHLPKPGPRP